MRILAEDSIALVIDFQERLVPVMEHREELLHNTQVLIKGLQALDVPIMVTQQYTKGLGETVPELAALFESNHDYMDKISFSCMEDELIEKNLKEFRKHNIILCGIEAHVCVLQTVIDLIAKGYQVILVEDCISSRKEKDCKIGIERAIFEGAIPATYESILFELTRKAKTDVFKKISKLVKE